MMQNIAAPKWIEKLLAFALQRQLIEPQDVCWIRNLLLGLLGLATPAPAAHTQSVEELEPILEALTDYACQQGLCDPDIDSRDRLVALWMGLVTARPSDITAEFQRRASRGGIDSATAWFYQLCQDNAYIRSSRIAQNERFFAPSEWGELEITINLSKPEKDPYQIAQLKNLVDTGYPKCPLCVDNVGFAGNVKHPARQNLRVIPITLASEQWYFQYSPYQYYPQHCILLHETHSDMHINDRTLTELLDFAEQFPHYFIGSNADLPIVGGSILNHHHFQGGAYALPIEKATSVRFFTHASFPYVRINLLNWPTTTLRLQSQNRTQLQALAAQLLSSWRTWDAPEFGIHSHSGDTPHNTVTPIVRMRNGAYEIDLALRNNRTTPERPMGLFHPNPSLHHIKKENIGLIEVMGLFILPGRLKHELSEVAACLCGQPLPRNTAHHDWIKLLASIHGTDKAPEEAQAIVFDALAEKCRDVLRDTGVYPLTDDGIDGVSQFLYHNGLS